MMKLRPVVRAFAEVMETKLRQHDEDRGSRGWENDTGWALFDRLNDEVLELRDAMRGAYTLKTEGVQAAVAADVLNEAADVANFAMMIADQSAALRAIDGYDQARAEVEREMG